MMLASAGGAVLAGCGGGGGAGEPQATGTASAATNTTTTTTTPTSASTSTGTAPGVNANNASATNPVTNSTSNTVTQAVASASSGLFYGINGHMAYGSGIYQTMSPAAQLAILQDLGVTNYRCDIAGGGMATTLANALQGPFANSGVSILPVLNPLSAQWDPHSSEAAAYSLGYDMAVRCTRPLKGLVKYIECGNELDVPLKIGGDGSSTADWDPACWPSLRGVLRGMIDGVRSVDPSIQCGVNVGIPMAYRALQMLWNGISPDGTAQGVSGAASLRWDITTYHWYESSGDIRCGGRYNACVDVLQVLKDSFNVPIWLTEWGWNGANDTPQQAAAYTGRALAEYYAVKDRYNIQSIMMYAVIDSDYGLIQADGVTKNPAYAVFKNFVAANPA
ncbi:glycosyl hydrolase [Caballeronia sp. LZ062]|uniref:glycosyl hydrolase n=1 Tax=unclassified Caballeronia TaxID=2646786 RepID=UPI002863CD90|nr:MULTISPECIES: glycosyl hydrolase [unclassified Caballeronia]MDR5857690.1 glycosyl hydrolase [Caballeronia sp. LZ050]MDR5869240.1 glycosyl hydrolase [Caballeronia sp. LZ062]